MKGSEATIIDCCADFSSEMSAYTILVILGLLFTVASLIFTALPLLPVAVLLLAIAMLVGRP